MKSLHSNTKHATTKRETLTEDVTVANSSNFWHFHHQMSLFFPKLKIVNSKRKLKRKWKDQSWVLKRHHHFQSACSEEALKPSETTGGKNSMQTKSLNVSGSVCSCQLNYAWLAKSISVNCSPHALQYANDYIAFELQQMQLAYIPNCIRQGIAFAASWAHFLGKNKLQSTVPPNVKLVSFQSFPFAVLAFLILRLLNFKWTNISNWKKLSIKDQLEFSSSESILSVWQVPFTAKWSEEFSFAPKLSAVNSNCYDGCDEL